MSGQGEQGDFGMADALGQPLPQQVPQRQAPPTQVPPGFNPNADMQIFMTMMQQQMMQFMQSNAASTNLQPANQGALMHQGKLDERDFRRLKEVSNKRDDWKEWRLHFLTSVGKCNSSFMDLLKGLERQEEPLETVDLSPAQEKLSASLQARLIGLTTKQAFAIVESTQGYGWKPGVF